MTGNRAFDVIIAGAGAAGCVLAGRLSEDPERQVLLIESGPDAPAGKEHPDILDPFPVSYGNPRFCWAGLSAEINSDYGNEKRSVSGPYVQGFGVGGGSNVNGMAADRGNPADYEDWRAHGAAGWGWQDVLPYFNRLERDLDFAGPMHGDKGPIPVRRVRPDDWAPFAKAFGEAVARRGFPRVKDFNADFDTGLSSVPMNCLPDRRVSASMAYLTRAVRQRPNLTILPNATVDCVTISEGRARGVVVRTAEGSRQFEADETILSCGALQSPAVLMRSGVGPATHLRAMAIPVERDLPGVGRNLQNHIVITLVTHLPRSAAQLRSMRTWQQNQLRYSSGYDGCPDNDMLMIPFNKVAWHPLGRRIAALIPYVLKCFSTGHVELVSADCNVAPRVHFNLFSDKRDFERLVSGLKFAFELLADAEVAKAHNEVFLPDGNIVGRLARRGRWTWLQSWVIARLFDSALLRRMLLRKSALDIRRLARDETALRQFVREAAQPVYHVCGTCRMGGEDDPEAVTDSACRVRGVGGLRVIDASIFPSVPSGNTHLPVLMAAEKMADQIRNEWRPATAARARLHDAAARPPSHSPVRSSI